MFSSSPTQKLHKQPNYPLRLKFTTINSSNRFSCFEFQKRPVPWTVWSGCHHHCRRHHPRSPVQLLSTLCYWIIVLFDVSPAVIHLTDSRRYSCCSCFTVVAEQRKKKKRSGSTTAKNKKLHVKKKTNSKIKLLFFP